jgi:hypothetical protein
MISGLLNANSIKYMNNKQKIGILLFALICNFTFLTYAQETPSAASLPECVKSYGKDSLETRRNMFLFQEGFKNKEYKESYPNWSYVFNNAPCAFKSIHQNGAILLNELIKNPTLAARKEKLIDTLLLIFPTRIKYFGEEGFVKGEWALNMSKLRPANTSEIIKLYASYYELEKDNIYESKAQDYLKNAVEANKKALMTKEELFDLFDRLNNTADFNLTKFSNDSNKRKNWLIVQNNMQKIMTPYLKCAEIDLIYQPKLKANPEDVALMLKVIKYYKAAKLCNESPNFISLLEKKYSIEPDAVAAEELAKIFDKKKLTPKANEYWDKAADLSEDSKKKEEIYIMLAKRNQANASLSKSYAAKTLAINPNNGYALILQGTALYKSASGCDAFNKAAAACEAVEYFNRAKNSGDPKIIAEANKQIAQYKKYYPLKKDAFFRNLKEGDSYTISCLGISTTLHLR